MGEPQRAEASPQGLPRAQGRAKSRIRPAVWREQVFAEADLIEHELETLCIGRSPGLEREAIDAARVGAGKHLRAARRATGLDPDDRPSWWFRFRDRWVCASVEGAYRQLHAAEVAVSRVLPEEELEARTPAVLARLRGCLGRTDPRLSSAEAILAGTPLSPRRRAAFTHAVRLGYDVADQQHARVRSFRNILVAWTAALALLVAAVGVVGALAPSAIPICFEEITPSGQQPTAPPGAQPGEALVCPSSRARGGPTSGDVGIVALVGLLGGALSATVAISNLRGTSTPYAVPVALSLLKLPAGALTAVVGIVLVHGQFVPGLSQLDSQGQIIAYALVFGIAQHAFTKAVDKRAQEVLGGVTGKEPSRADYATTQRWVRAEVHTAGDGAAREGAGTAGAGSRTTGAGTAGGSGPPEPGAAGDGGLEPAPR